jgi:hypothetical protein
MDIHLNKAKRFERVREQMSAAGIEVIENNVGRPGMGMFVAGTAGIEMICLAYRSLAARRIESGAYLRSIQGVRRRAVFALRDPWPLLYDVLRSPGQVYRRRS